MTILEKIKQTEARLKESDVPLGESQHLKKLLDDLLEYLLTHSDSDECPSALELYCNINPDALECRIYE